MGEAPRLGCLATFMLAAIVAAPLFALGIPDQAAFAIAVVVVLISAAYMHARGRDR